MLVCFVVPFATKREATTKLSFFLFCWRQLVFCLFLFLFLVLVLVRAWVLASPCCVVHELGVCKIVLSVVSFELHRQTGGRIMPLVCSPVSLVDLVEAWFYSHGVSCVEYNRRGRQ